MNTSALLRVAIKPRLGKRAKAGHPWIFSNEITHPKPKPDAGVAVEVVDDADNFLGYGTYNPHSLISIRLLSRNKKIVPGSSDWFVQKIQSALSLRERIYPGRRSYRLIYADSDGLPGVIVDRYEDVLVVQVHSAGMERLIEPLNNALKQVIDPATIVLRNQHEKRKLEDLPMYCSIPLGSIDAPVVFEENGITLAADVLEGQKTGHFFDQAENRLAIQPYTKDAAVLDLFCHTGAWALSMLQGGAKRAIAVDSSEPAIAAAIHNAKQNGFGKSMECIKADAFAWLTKARQENVQFDVVVVDPPAFAKSAKQSQKALRGYEDLNRQAIHLIKDGGILCACSCSYFISEELFIGAIHKAASRERKVVQILEIRGQAKDHPIHIAMPETRYLKCVIGMVRDH
jgi:23S rRNA (cytosine1962-C5)-methyltransferase